MRGKKWNEWRKGAQNSNSNHGSSDRFVSAQDREDDNEIVSDQGVKLIFTVAAVISLGGGIYYLLRVIM
jgi:hypothetical protein